MTIDDGRPGADAPRASAGGRFLSMHGLLVVAVSLVLALGVAAALTATGLAAGARAVLQPAPMPTGTTPAWLAPPSSAPTLAGAAPLAASAPAPDPAVLAAQLAPILAPFRAPGGGSLGAVVLDGATGGTLHGREGSVPRVPASNLKLLTAAAVLTTLGPDAVLRTRAVRGEEPGTVILVAGGDVLLGAGESQPGEVLGRAGLATLAAATARALTGSTAGADGPDAPDGPDGPDDGGSAPSADEPAAALPAGATVTVRLDDSLFTGPALNPAWAHEDIEAGEMAPLHALALNAGRTAPNAPAPRPADAGLDAAAAFRAALEKALAPYGIRVAAGVERAHAPTPSRPGTALAAVESAPVADQVGYMLLESDNYTAEALARLASAASGGPTSTAGAVRALRDAAERVLGSAEGLVLEDASGLAAGNRVAPETLAGIVREMAVGRDARLRPALDGLPIAGLTGTLGGRFGPGTTAAGAGVVRAKTGTLLAVAGLTGYTVDADGRLLVFSFVANGLTADTREAALAAIDGAAARLAGCGCR
ncbi:D-alanyl-D-alanine carboxypeptidase/D-alanyl-D-alanine endopeptidase [Sinomonas mesophila]|uniref:D-alanyl-D-alanine carboxypeptidase/D-alanyl-D-alanine endopeptidase n=1 Tax=Sinomonas mesophila TaxID=1531955 RepID=UPI0009849699|nr:D-alanyl-D-alanine carboxypeptidase/D-alanyl-D-alanine-endopeptidase [Sinomonas mesophila]